MPTLCILIIDDNRADIILMRENLDKAIALMPEMAAEIGFNMKEADSVESAIALLKTTSCDIALLDLKIPPYDGTEGVKVLKGAFPWLPVIVVSGNESEAVALEAVHAGADDYVLKTEISPKRLIRAVRYTLERSKKFPGNAADTKNLERLHEIVKRLP